MAGPVEVLRAEDLAPDSVTALQVRSRRVAVVHCESGFYALDDESSHPGGTLGEGDWRGRPLTDIRTIVELIAATTTKTGLSVQAAYDPNWYPTGVKITDAELAAVPLHPHDFHGEWNYTITAQSDQA